jgi:hypothetical protein
MKKLIVIAAFLWSQCAIADGMQMVLDKVHEIGFRGCDRAIGQFIKNDPILYVEARLLKGEDAALVGPDAIEIHVGSDWAITGYLVRKTKGVCSGSRQMDIRMIANSCENVISNNERNGYNVVGRSGGASWLKAKWENISPTITIAGAEGCVLVNTTQESAGLGVKIDSK